VTPPGHDQEPKSVLRERLRARRRARPGPVRAEDDADLATRVMAIPAVAALVTDPSGGCVAAYASFGTEPRTMATRDALARAGVRVLLPVIRDDGGLDFSWDGGDDLGDGTVSPGIPEPTGPVAAHGMAGLLELGCVVVLTPALAVDAHGNRIGKAGGYYDRLLAGLDDVPPARRPLLVAVVHDDEVLDHVPTLPHDRPVDAAVTPARFLVLR
jgi:5-formyltetrahydrofolate cyclo-ligase